MRIGRRATGLALVMLAAVGAVGCSDQPVRGAGAGPAAGSTSPPLLAPGLTYTPSPTPTSTSVGPPGPLVPGGRYRPVAGLCSRIDLSAVRRRASPLTTVEDRIDRSPRSYDGTYCSYRAEQLAGQEPASLDVTVSAQLYGDPRAAASPYDGTARTPSMTCPKAGYTRRTVAGLGSRALSEQCSDPRYRTVMYKLLVQADNLCLDVAVSQRGERQLPRMDVVAGFTRGLVDSALTLLDGR